MTYCLQFLRLRCQKKITLAVQSFVSCRRRLAPSGFGLIALSIASAYLAVSVRERDNPVARLSYPVQADR